MNKSMASWHTLTVLPPLIWRLTFSWECENKSAICYSSTASISALRDQGHCQLTRRRTKKAECPAHKGVKVTAVAHHYNLLPVVQIFRDILQQEEHRLGSCDLRTSTKNKSQSILTCGTGWVIHFQFVYALTLVWGVRGRLESIWEYLRNWHSKHVNMGTSTQWAQWTWLGLWWSQLPFRS